MKPNVIIINCDDLGYGDLECYGSEINNSPFINEMAKKGTLFSSAYAASSICTPSRAGLMTGCYPTRLSINRVLFPGEAYGLSKDEYTMPMLFKENGYKTKIVGKWHLGDQKEFMPSEYGFDEYFGLPYSNDMGRQIRKDGTMSPNPPLPLIEDTEVVQAQPDQCALTERYTHEALNFIRENKDQSFFLYLAHMHVHLPLYSAKRFGDESRNGDFGACVAETDWSCGVIMNELKVLGLEENTLVIFTSDNGSTGLYGACNKPLKSRKTTSYEGGFRVPFIAVFKGKIQEGKINDDIISHMDLLPTFASMLGTKPEKWNENTIDGEDISKTLFAGETVRDEFAYYVLRNTKNKLADADLEAVRKGDYKLYFCRRSYPDNTHTNVKELYNLKNDIGESTNIYDNHPEIVTELTSIYNKYVKDLGNYSTGIKGENVRPCAEVENPVCLTEYDENHPYIMAFYDKTEQG